VTTPDDLDLLRRTVRRFIDDEAVPLEAAVLRHPPGEAPPSLTAHLDRRARELGLWNLDVPLGEGGAGLSQYAFAVLREEIHRTATPLAIGGRISPILWECSAGQRPRFLDPVLRGEHVSAFAQTEPDAGSDAAAITTTATRSGDGWRIDGRKIFITDGHKADTVQVLTVTDREKRQRGGMTMFVVERERPGFSVARRTAVMGWESPAELVFDGVEVPDANRIGAVGDGWRLAQAWITGYDRLGLGPTALGRMERAMEITAGWVQQRVTFGKPLADRQAIQFALADSVLETHLLRLLTHDAARAADAGDDYRNQASMVRLYASEAQARVLDRAIQALGGYGLTDDLPLARWYQAARVYRINGGSSEMQRFLLARSRLPGIDLRR
jgi:alkylation response protein AidB-like acyl-CoA dehydrogenase